MIEVDAVVLAAMPQEMAPFEERAVVLGRRSQLGEATIRLESIRSATSPTGYLLVDYRVIG